MSLYIHDNFLLFICSKVIRFGTCLTHRDGILRLKMAWIVNHGHGDFAGLASFAATRKFLTIANRNMGWEIVDTIYDLLRDIILSRSLIKQVSEWILIEHH